LPIEALQKVWIAVALICLIVALDFFAATQNWPINFGTKLVVEFKLSEMPPIHAAVIGLVFVLTFYCLVTWLGWVHARRMIGRPAERFPFRLFGIDMNSRDGRTLQWVAGVLSLVFPLYAIGHFWRIMLNATVCHIRGDVEPSYASIWDINWLQTPGPADSGALDHGFRIGDKDHACEGVTFFPFFEPALLLLMTLLALYFLVRLTMTIFLHPQNNLSGKNL